MCPYTNVGSEDRAVVLDLSNTANMLGPLMGLYLGPYTQLFYRGRDIATVITSVCRRLGGEG